MNIRFRLTALAIAGAATLGLATTSHAQADKVNLGVAIPAATHSFTAGIVFWANEAKRTSRRPTPA